MYVLQWLWLSNSWVEQRSSNIGLKSGCWTIFSEWLISIALVKPLTLAIGKGSGNGFWSEEVIYIKVLKKVMAISTLDLFQHSWDMRTWARLAMCMPFPWCLVENCGSMMYQLKSVNYACRDWEASKRGILVHVGWNKGMKKDLHTSKRERWGHIWALFLQQFKAHFTVWRHVIQILN